MSVSQCSQDCWYFDLVGLFRDSREKIQWSERDSDRAREAGGKRMRKGGREGGRGELLLRDRERNGVSERGYSAFGISRDGDAKCPIGATA